MSFSGDFRRFEVTILRARSLINELGKNESLEKINTKKSPGYEKIVDFMIYPV